MNNLQRRITTAEQMTTGACLPWLVRAKAYGNRHGYPFEQSLAMLGAPEEVAARIKAAVAATTTDSDLAGSSAIVTAFVEQLAEQSILARLFSDGAAQRVPLRTRLVGLNSNLSAGVVAEGAPIPVGAMDFSGQSILPFKIAALTVLSDELWEGTSSAAQGYVITKLREAVARAADEELFNRLTDSSTLETTADVDDAGAIISGLRLLLDGVHTRAGSRLNWAVSPAAANVLATSGTRDDINAFNGSILDLPATITTGLLGRRVALIDGRAVGGLIEGVRVEASNRGAVQMDDSPTNEPLSPTATNLVSLFQTGSTAVRICFELAAEPIRDNPMAVLELTETS